MAILKENLLVQFSVVSFVIMAVLAAVIAVALTLSLANNVELLKDHGSAMMAGQMIQPRVSLERSRTRQKRPSPRSRKLPRGWLRPPIRCPLCGWRWQSTR